MATSKIHPLPLVKVAMPPRERLLPALEEILYSGMIGEGEAVYTFERRFGEQFGLPTALATSSGTGALHVAMLLAGAGPGREVITTSMTAEPTNTVIVQTGATPVFADVDAETGNLSPEAVAAAVTDRTAAICVVHYAGYPADLGALRAIADRHGVALIEDCAHALGAHYDGKPIGAIGDSAIYSLQAIKHMTTVDGGVLALRDAEQAALARQLRWFGLTKGVPRTEVDMTRPGYKYNMSNVTATIGLAQLDHIDPLVARHRDNGRFFDRELAGIAGIRPAKLVEGSDPSYWLYTLLADDSDAVEACLAAVNVSASKLHRPNHYHSLFAPFAGPLPGLDDFYRRLVHIPCGWWVDDDDRARIVDALAKG
jgi:dTDP-4-amino-4,6-dideoxygalactose transaminase